ncbi:MAG: hypothetical protein JWO86_3805 [Myxococcaceae bacterium]|nr:hypothetical protein [Myxococcaceae bacterium]
MLTNPSRIGLPLLLALTSMACTIATAPTSSGPSASDAGDAPAPDGQASSAAVEVEEVALVGTSITSAISATGTFGVTTIPRSALHDAILDKNQPFAVHIVSPAGIELEAPVTECTARAPALQPSAFGVIVDGSGDMAQDDPQLRRKDATIQFIKTLGVDQPALLGEVGPIAFTMRDMLCQPTADPNSCPLVDAKPLTSDKTALIAGAAKIHAVGPDELFGACAYMAGILDGLKDRRSGIVVLSNGRPDAQDPRLNDCQMNDPHIPVYTLGIGPGAEGGPDADPSAVATLRTTSALSGGSYTSADSPDLDSFFKNMNAAVDRGSCQTTTRLKNPTLLRAGTKVEGEVVVGNKGAKAAFTFVAPSSK